MKLKLTLSALAIVVGTLSLQAQANDDVVLKAMKDEIDSNLNGLQLPDFEKPFFIMYGVLEQKNYSITASMGSLLSSTVDEGRSRSTSRVLVGDYQFNDESLEDNHTSLSSRYDISLPVENDYWGIRRSFWSVTDNVYQSAARNFEKNKESLKETGKTLEQIPHRSFAKMPPVNLYGTLTPYAFDKKSWEEKMKRLSESFLSHPNIWSSSVMLTYSEGYRYLVNTEGTMVRTPFNLATLRIVALSRNAQGEQTVKGFAYVFKTPEQLPTEAQLMNEIKVVIDQIENQTVVQELDQDYSGPVLVMGEPVAEIFASSLFGKEGVVASDDVQKLTGFQHDPEYSAESKVGKMVVNEMISVNAVPKMKMFNGIELLGSFEVDEEGVAAPDEVKVIENGVLKSLLNNRTLTSKNQIANGFSSGPGVIQVKINGKDTEKSLKKKLIEKAKKQKLEYAILFRSGNDKALRLPDVYKVYVADGREELIKGATINRVSIKDLKHEMRVTSAYNVFNIGNLNNASRSGQGITSYIVPAGILLDDMEVSRYHLPSYKEENFVKNPLEK